MSIVLQVTLACAACGAAQVEPDDILCRPCRERIQARTRQSVAVRIDLDHSATQENPS